MPAVPRFALLAASRRTRRASARKIKAPPNLAGAEVRRVSFRGGGGANRGPSR